MTIALLVSPGSVTETQDGTSHKSERNVKDTIQGRAGPCPNSSRFGGNGEFVAHECGRGGC